MNYDGLLKSAATATTNPDPNSLTTKDPYGAFTNRYAPQADWTTQAATNCKALVCRGASNRGGTVPLSLAFVPANGAAVTYTVTIWEFNKLAGVWMKPQANSSFSLTGYQSVQFPNPGEMPYFIQLSSISAGNIGIYFDNGVALAL